MTQLLVTDAFEERSGSKGNNVKVKKTFEIQSGGQKGELSCAINSSSIAEPTGKKWNLAFSSKGKNEFPQAEQLAQPVRNSHNSTNEKL